MAGAVLAGGALPLTLPTGRRTVAAFHEPERPVRHAFRQSRCDVHRDERPSRAERGAHAERHVPGDAAGDLPAAEGFVSPHVHADRFDHTDVPADRLAAAAGGGLLHGSEAETLFAADWDECDAVRDGSALAGAHLRADV